MIHSDDRTIRLVYGADALEMTMALLESAHIAEEIPAGASIGLKPNLVVAAKPEQGATTHAGVLEGCIRYLQDHGHRNITIMEGSWIGDNTARAFRVTGYDAIGRRYNVPLLDLKRDRTRSVKTPAGTMNVCVTPLETDYLINLPVLKGHCQTVMTCALKNMKGCLPDSEKRNFHAQGLMRPIAGLATVLRPSLTIVDSICGDLNFEEGGNPIQTNRMYMGRDSVQLDAFGCRLMGIDPEEVSYIGLAEQYGAGSTELRDEDLVFLNEPSDAPAYPRPSGLVSRLTRNVDQRSACSACYGNLVHALYRLRQERRGGYDGPISIGQEFRGRSISGVGIGRCCAGAEHPVPGCPPTAEAIMQVLSGLE